MPRLVITGFPGRLQASIAAGVGLIPGRGAKTPYALLPRKKEKKKPNISLVTSCSSSQETKTTNVGHNPNSMDLDWSHLREMTSKEACGELTGILDRRDWILSLELVKQLRKSLLLPEWTHNLWATSGYWWEGKRRSQEMTNEWISARVETERTFGDVVEELQELT